MLLCFSSPALSLSSKESASHIINPSTSCTCSAHVQATSSSSPVRGFPASYLSKSSHASQPFCSESLNRSSTCDFDFVAANNVPCFIQGRDVAPNIRRTDFRSPSRSCAMQSAVPQGLEVFSRYLADSNGTGGGKAISKKKESRPSTSALAVTKQCVSNGSPSQGSKQVNSTETAEAFKSLVDVVDSLLDPETGCPWDLSQTPMSLRQYLLEEVYELIEAMDLDDESKTREEIGDVVYNLLFLCRLAQRENRFNAAEALTVVTEKLINRHPHVFGDVTNATMEVIHANWERIKRSEAQHVDRTSALDGIPRDLPALARAHKALSRLSRAGYDPAVLRRGPDFMFKADSVVDCRPPRREEEGAVAPTPFANEDQLGEELLKIVERARMSGLNAEQALLKVLSSREHQFRSWETQQQERDVKPANGNGNGVH